MSMVSHVVEHDQERRDGRPTWLVGPATSAASLKPLRSAMEEEMIGLYNAVDSLLPKRPKKVIQFIGSRKGEGTSTIIRDFATVSAVRLGKPVLVLNADGQHRHAKNAAHDDQGCHGSTHGQPVEEAFYKCGESHILVGSVTIYSTELSEVLNGVCRVGWFEKLQQTFDLILVDSPPANTSPDPIHLSRKVDGVILVVEADNTRWPVAKSVKDRIIQNGGNILGVILNKRHYYIPKCIYNHF